ncbi:MAG: hypothetical protein HQ559_08470 [Lentisphaerae bacterium]|nr:hypothetical protein [Lentisphaerota bacterium]
MSLNARTRAGYLFLLASVALFVGSSQCSPSPRVEPSTDSVAGLDTGTDSDTAADVVSYAIIPEGCNPLASEWDCLLPYPSDFFLVEDASMPSGRRLAIIGAARLERPDGRFVEPYLVHPADGFSHHPPILALFPGGVDPDNLVFHTGDVADSLGPDSPTVLLEAESGDRVLHFAELDPRPEDDATRALMIRPLVRLRNGSRYIVAIRGLRDHGGALIEAPAGFRHIRDGEAAGDPVLGPMAERYDGDLFPVLEAAGVDRAGLQLAWDFTTQTEEHVTGDMLAIRADLMARLEQMPPVVTILSVTENVSDRVLRQVEGTIRVPLYVDSDKPASRLNRDPEGGVIAVGEAEVPFILHIPMSLQGFDGQLPARILQYGHGFFAGRSEIESGWLNELADRFGFVLVTADWWGMSSFDLDPTINAIVSEPSELLLFTDRLHQGLANQIALSYAVAGPLAEAPEVQIDGVTVYDPAQIYFYGVSQGGVLGGTYAPLAPLIERAVLGVGGASFTLMMFRSRYFASFLFLLESFVEGPFDAQKWVALLPTTFDRIDPITYAPHGIRDLYPNGPVERRILMQNAIGDTDVTNLASHLEARTLGVKLLQPSPRQISFLDTVEAPTDESAIVEFDFGVPEPLPGTEARLPKSSNDGHNGLRKLDASMLQIDAFLRPGGHIEHTCDGPCDPE